MEFPFPDFKIQERNQGLKTSEKCPARCHLCFRPVDGKHDFVALCSPDPARFFDSVEAMLADKDYKTADGELYWRGGFYVCLVTLGPECAKKMPKGSVFKADEARALLANHGIKEE